MDYEGAVVDETPSEIEIYNRKWQALLDHVHSGLELRDQLRAVIDAYGKQAPPAEKTETDPVKRFDQVKARVAALSAHFAEVVGVVTVWAEGLKPLLRECSASLDGLPLFGAVDEVHSAFARVENRGLPAKPHLDLNNAESLERRARWLREVAEIMVRVESGPRDIGASIRALEAVLQRFNDEMESARGRGRKVNVSALRWLIPIHPALGAPVPAPMPAKQPDPYEWLTR